MFSDTTKTTKPTISIALATFNGSKYIADQIESIKKQSILPDQLVICDDNSCDDTVDKVKTLTSDVPFKVYIHKNSINQGYTSNFEGALSYCYGDLIFLCDQDDVWYPSKIETIIKHFMTNPNKQVIIHDLEYCNEELNPIGQTKIGRMKHLGDLNQIYVTGMATALRRSFLDLCFPIPKNDVVTHDFWIHICANLLGVKLVVPDILSLYRRHQSNATLSQSTNTSEKTSKLFFMNKYFHSSSKKSLINNRIADETLINWVVQCKEVILTSNIISQNKLQHNIAQLYKHRNWTNFRLDTLQKPRLQRIIPAIALYLNGGYKQFSGIKSMLKDLLVTSNNVTRV